MTFDKTHICCDLQVAGTGMGTPKSTCGLPVQIPRGGSLGVARSLSHESANDTVANPTANSH